MKLLSLMRCALSLIVLLGVTAALAGCAVGRNELTGGVVFGADLGTLAENTNQLAAGAVSDLSGLLPPPFGQLATLGGALLLGHFQGTRKGWDEREAAASIQQPLAGIVPGPPEAKA